MSTMRDKFLACLERECFDREKAEYHRRTKAPKMDRELIVGLPKPVNMMHGPSFKQGAQWAFDYLTNKYGKKKV